MRVVLIIALCEVFTLARPGLERSNYFGYPKFKIDNKELLQKQKDILQLYKHINQPYYYNKDQFDVVKSWSFESNINSYTNQTAAKQFLLLFLQGMLPKGEIFSVFYDYHLEQAIALFNIFYYAEDYDTFYKTAVYMRGKMNEGLYLYALSVAIVHRPDTYGIVIPPIYEVYPYYFFNTEVIQKGYQYKMRYMAGSHEDAFTIITNYTGWYVNIHPEQSMSYYTEDIGINLYYWYYNLYYPFWMASDQFSLKYDKRGEQYYYVYQQLLARYYLERLSNGLNDFNFIDWESPVPVGYYPSLQYPNGLTFPSRPHYAKLSEYFYNYGQKWWFSNKYAWSYTYVRDYEARILQALDSGYINSQSGDKINLFTPEGFNILGNLIEGNADSPNQKYYGQIQTFARHLLGYSQQPLKKYHAAPSSLEHFETSMRDPAFYMFYKKIIWFFQSYKSSLKPYSYNELYYPGVKIEGVEFDRLITYFDYFNSDITNGIFVTQPEYDQMFEGNQFVVFAKQLRLNHKQFSYKITVTTEKRANSVVKVYLGPKYDEFNRAISINENRIHFVQFDEFNYTLEAGKNVIERNPHENYYYAPDRTSFEDLYKKVVAAINGDEEFQMDGSEAYYGFPLRYLLPKGTHDGFPYQFYVIIVPYRPPHHKPEADGAYFYPRVGTGGQYIDTYPLGFPFDRPIDEYNFYVPNSFFHETKIYNRKHDDLNVSHRID